jgi:diadenosine tetraphosphatase ApaH/serine/threonine PP2A family protein phosphatase
MKHAILSDIHSNLEALTVCREHALAQGAQRFVSLGDCVGYGADPGPTLRLLMSLPGLVAVRGNHDDALFREAGEDMPPGVAEAIAWTRAQLTSAQRDFLANLPYVYREGRVTYVHASAHNPGKWDYLFQLEQAEECLKAADTPLIFVGHVHVPKVFYETPAGILRELVPAFGATIPLSAHSRYVVNVGSVGQPRDGNSAACYVLHDDAAETVAFYRLAYDYSRTADKIRAAGLHPSFAERLAYGR